MSMADSKNGYASNVATAFRIPLSAAGRILFVLIQKGFKKIKFAVMHINERLSWVGLKLALARKRSDSKPTVKRRVHLPDSDDPDLTSQMKIHRYD